MCEIKIKCEKKLMRDKKKIKTQQLVDEATKMCHSKDKKAG